MLHYSLSPKSKRISEDLTQQTFIKVWQQLDSFRGDSTFLLGFIELQLTWLKILLLVQIIKNKNLIFQWKISI